MASHINKVMIVGRLTRDPNLRQTNSGSPVTDFGLASNRNWKSKDGELHRDTVFVDVTAWGTLAELTAKHLSKGTLVLIEGSLRLDQWESKEGERRSKLYINLDSFQAFQNGNAERVYSDASKGAEDVEDEDDEPLY